MPAAVNEHQGRALVGGDPTNYDAIRPPYPDQVSTFLPTTGALRPTVVTLELGAGNGLASRRLLELGADPLTLLAPDVRFAQLLTAWAATHAAQVHGVPTSVDAAAVPARGYDLVAAATWLHGGHPSVRGVKAAQVLTPGGDVAVWWTVVGDPERADRYHAATQRGLDSGARSPCEPRNALPVALDTLARRGEISATGAFDAPDYAAYRWGLWVSTHQVGALYAPFSSMSR